jgi:methylmalonyl-CoA mutase
MLLGFKSSLKKIKPIPVRWNSQPSYYEKWKKVAVKEVKTEENLKKLTKIQDEGFAIKPVYTSDDLIKESIDSVPGIYPYTRGGYATMYSVRPWTVR